MNYTLLTKSSLEIVQKDLGQEEETRQLLALYNEQYALLTAHGYDMEKCYKVHFFDSPYTYDKTQDDVIADAIQRLAIKDGYDIVKWENGNIGFVAYYSGVENGFEIIGESED